MLCVQRVHLSVGAATNRVFWHTALNVTVTGNCHTSARLSTCDHSMSTIDETCHAHYTGGRCAHYARYFYDDKPTLCTADELLGLFDPTRHAPELHTHLLAQQERERTLRSSTCGNPWNLIESKEAADKLRAARPVTQTLCSTRDAPSIPMHTEFLHGIETIRPLLQTSLEGDCRQVTVINSKTREPLDPLFSAVFNGRERRWETTGNREVEVLWPVVSEALTPSMSGKALFIEGGCMHSYFMPVPHLEDQFIHIVIHSSTL